MIAILVFLLLSSFIKVSESFSEDGPIFTVFVDQQISSKRDEFILKERIRRAVESDQLQVRSRKRPFSF